ncbi:metastasis-associated protein MTA1-like, partial [Sinocyclocheilus grahami]|uniref:metastasis-associated protein MTA1-like n=1 Tax=Sinocyclocheilus grahami TaxID=75366 RepID=UPI0007AD0E2F
LKNLKATAFYLFSYSVHTFKPLASSNITLHPPCLPSSSSIHHETLSNQPGSAETANGNVEAKVVCFYRRRDISTTLIALADKHAREMEEEMENPEIVDLPEKQKHQLRHRELFLSRQLESLPATHIRGKCCVTLLNETEALTSYLDREDAFFYSLVYDPQQKTLLADKGEIRVGNKYQADITDLLKEGKTSLRLIELDMVKALSSSDETINPPHITAILLMILVKYSAFIFLFQLPWKSLTSIIEYYYMWKTTDRYVQQKRLKAAEAESKLKQVYIPNYNKPSPNQLSVNSVKPGLVNGAGALPGSPGQPVGLGRACESCFTTSSYQWYSWGPPNMQCRLCASCWTYWKKYGGLKMPTRLDGERPGPNRNSMSPHGLPMRHGGSPKFAVKTRQAFYLHTSQLTKATRRVCQDLLRSRYLARHPYIPVNTTAIKAECAIRLPDMSKKPPSLKQTVRKPLESVVRYLEAHPCPPKSDPPRGATISMGSLTPIKSTPILNNGSPTILGKRTYEQHNGLDGSKPKILAPQWEIMAKRVSEAGRTPSGLQDEVHELD